jgi:MFS family permease
MLFGNRRFIRMCFIAALLSLFTVSDGLFYLTVQQHTGMPNYAVTALFAGSATVFMLSAIGFGRLADRYSPIKLFIGAYCGLLLLYVLWTMWSSYHTAPSPVLLSWQNILVAVTIVVLVGFFYGASEGILVASLAKQLSPAVLTTGLALFTTVQGLVKIISSTLYGWLWQTFNTNTAIQLYAAGLALCILIAVLVWRKQDT